MVTGTNAIPSMVEPACEGSGSGTPTGGGWYSGSEIGIGAAVCLVWNMVRQGLITLNTLSRLCINVIRNKINPQMEPMFRIQVKARDSKVGNSGGIILLMSRRGPVVPMFIPHWVWQIFVMNLAETNL